MTAIGECQRCDYECFCGYEDMKTLQGPTERQRIATAKARQDHDADPPRCMNCVYFRREPHTKFIEREARTRNGKLKTVRVPLKKHPIRNPIVDRCSFGNFEVKPHHVCNEWHSHSGELLEDHPTNGSEKAELGG